MLERAEKAVPLDLVGGLRIGLQVQFAVEPGIRRPVLREAKLYPMTDTGAPPPGAHVFGDVRVSPQIVLWVPIRARRQAAIHTFHDEVLERAGIDTVTDRCLHFRIHRPVEFRIEQRCRRQILEHTLAQEMHKGRDIAG
jgi:hypothetical protein